MGYERELTPNLDRIAGEGALFMNAFASDIPTQPSHTAIFTGRFGVNTGIVSHFHPPSQLDVDASWLPSIFQGMGYATGAVDHLFAMKDWFVRGYSDYMPPEGRSRAPGSTILDIATPWLDTHKDEDFFLFLHFWDAHIPYLPPSPYKEEYTASSRANVDPLIQQRLESRPTYPLFARNLYDHLDAIPNLDYIADLYDAEIAYLDYEIGRLFDHLGELGLLESTMVVLFGDHGENMTEHDAWFDHAGLYDSVVHVPLILWAPGLVPNKTVTTMVSTVDVKPTVLDLMGMAQVPGMDGRSLVPLMSGQVTSHRDMVFLSECTWQAKRGVRTSEWKFIRCTDPGMYPRDGWELYRLADDPGEQHNLAAEFPDVAGELNGILSDWLTEQLGDRADPMDEVVSAGLPAVRRLEGVIAELAEEAIQNEKAESLG
jgi:arylsulfatase